MSCERCHDARVIVISLDPDGMLEEVPCPVCVTGEEEPDSLFLDGNSHELRYDMYYAEAYTERLGQLQWERWLEIERRYDDDDPLEAAEYAREVATEAEDIARVGTDAHFGVSRWD